MNDREIACVDINAIYYSHLLNYQNWDAEKTLANWYKKAKPKLSRKEWDDLCKEVKKYMKQREEDIHKWTRETIDENLTN